jgi:hypothetical protein
MFYKFDKNELLWKKNYRKLFHSIIVVMVLLLSSFISGRYIKFQSLEEYEKELIVLNVQTEKTNSPRKNLLKNLNV